MATALSSPLSGQQAEDLACRYLQAQGLQVLERNYRCTRGEIDLIMEDTQGIIFVEVRYRRDLRFGSSAESVDYRKQAKLISTALNYLQQHKSAARRPSRFDVIALSPGVGHDQVEWIKDAFQA